MSPELFEAVSKAGRSLHFAEGEVLRQKGTFAEDLLLLAKGEVDCHLTDDGAQTIRLGPGAIVGERGFLTGKGANATLVAVGPVEAVSLDPDALKALQASNPMAAADVLRLLAGTMMSRDAENEALSPETVDLPPDGIEILRCSTLDQRRAAERLRQDVLNFNIGEVPPDGSDGRLQDPLEREGISFLALQDGLTLASARVNSATDPDPDGSFAALGITAPGTACVLSDFSVRPAQPGQDVRLRLLGACIGSAIGTEATELYHAASQTHLDIFAAVGFVPSADPIPGDPDTVIHPLVLDLVAYQAAMPLDDRLSSDTWTWTPPG